MKTAEVKQMSIPQLVTSSNPEVEDPWILVEQQAHEMYLREHRDTMALDSDCKMRVNRSGLMYVRQLAGMQSFFEYSKKLPSKRICDVGAGTTDGIADLVDTGFTGDLEAWAMTLYPHRRIAERSLAERTKIDAMEYISRHFPHEFFGGIFGVHSVIYCAVPELVIDAVDWGLVDGGIFKTNLAYDPEAYSGRRMVSGTINTHHRFTKAFQQKGYGVARFILNPEIEILIAVKGRNDSVAQQLLMEDKLTMSNQLGKLIIL